MNKKKTKKWWLKIKKFSEGFKKSSKIVNRIRMNDGRIITNEREIDTKIANHLQNKFAAVPILTT